MWYAVLKKSFPYTSKLLNVTIEVRAGRVYKVKKIKDNPQLHKANVYFENIYNTADTFYFTVDEARDLFHPPTRDLDHAIETSILVCEVV